MPDKDTELREQLLAYTKQVTVHDAVIDGKTWYFRELDVAAGDEFTPLAQAVAEGKPIDGSFRARILRMTLCNPDGMLLFNKSMEAQLGRLPSKLGTKLVERALEFSGITDPEEAAKN